MRLFSRKPPYTLVFIHLPKTAGMSLHEVLLRDAGRAPTFWIVDPVKDTNWLQSIPIKQRERYVLVEGHMYYGVHEMLPRPCIYMTMLRNPVERVLSYYSHIRERDDHHLHEAARGLTLPECLRRGLTVELDNFMVRSLTGLHNVGLPFGGVTRAMLEEAKAHLDGMLIGLTERFEESMAYFRGRLDWARAAAPRNNVTAARLKQDDLTVGELDLVRSVNALDAELYQYACGLFERRLSSTR